MTQMEIKRGKPSETAKGIVPLRIEKHEPYIGNRREFGVKLQLEDGGFAYVIAEQVFLRFHRQMEILYKSLPQSKSWYLENSAELFELAIQERTPIIFERVVEEAHHKGSKVQYWNYLVLDTDIASGTAELQHFSKRSRR